MPAAKAYQGGVPAAKAYQGGVPAAKAGGRAVTEAVAGSPPVRLLRCRTVAQGGFRSLSYVRDLPPMVIEEQSSSPDAALAASPSEALLAALGACLSSRIHANAVSGNIVVHSLELDVEVAPQASPMWAPPGQPPASIGFDAVRIAVRLSADAAPEALQALVAHAVLWSRVANTIHDPVHLDVVLVKRCGPHQTGPGAG